MKMRKNIARLLIILAICTACFAAGCGNTTGKADETASEQTLKEAGAAYDKAAEYLQNYFGIEAGQETTQENVNGMIRALGGEPISAEVLTDGAVIEAGLKIAGPGLMSWHSLISVTRRRIRRRRSWKKPGSKQRTSMRLMWPVRWT